MQRRRSVAAQGPTSPFANVVPRRAFHSCSQRHKSASRGQDEEADDDSPWGDLDKAFENLQDKSLYQRVYATPERHSPSPAAAASADADSPARDPIAAMEEEIFARAGAAAVSSATPRKVSTAPLSGVRFSDAPPSMPEVSAGAAAPTGRWTEYMHGGSVDDSPWSSLDAFADNPESSAEFAVPLDLAAQHNLMQRSAEPYVEAHAPPRMHEGASAAAAFAANDTLLGQQALLSEQEALFAQAGAAAVNAQSPTLEADHLSHIDAGTGAASMVDVSCKPTTSRSATAVGRVYMPFEAAQLVRSAESRGGVSGKGPVLHTAQLAGIMAAKRTADLIPLCHPLSLTHVDVALALVDQPGSKSYVDIECTAKTAGATGVEMEALTGCTAACLTVWDMAKAVAGKTMRIGDVRVVRKTGGKSADWTRI
ncbi:hypothetical protein L1887_52118 [Cichorium endivia]|nr:hypothetical protein L1887_52118 [Cichorium endivia]